MNLFKYAAVFLCVATTAQADPVTINSCGTSYTYDQPPQRAITLNQQATEIMLALGLEDRMIGTAYLDDTVASKWQDTYAGIPVLADKYPAAEVVLANEPDFLFAGFSSAFSEDNLGNVQKWHDLGIGTYLVNASCKTENPTDEPMTFDPVLKDIEVLGKIFDVEERANALITATQTRIDTVRDAPSGGGSSVFIYDSGTDTPYTVGCCGAPALITRTVGLANISAGIKGTWVDLSWEHVVATDPDVILLIDADWSKAADKRAYLEADPVLSELTAVKEGRFLTIPFSETLLGIRIADGVETLNNQLKVMH